MSDQEAREFIQHNKFGVLSLANEGQAYGVPLFYGYDGRDVYFQTHVGIKSRYARMTREACFTIVRVMGLDDWASVHLFGRLLEVGDGLDRIRASHALLSVPLPPELGESPFAEPLRSEATVTYRLMPTRIAGRYSETPGKHEGQIALAGG